MLSVLMLFMMMFLPLAAMAEPAPEGCAEHFLGREMPTVVNRVRTNKTRLLCFSQYALLHSGVAKTAVWSAEHLTSDRIESAGSAGKRPNNFHAEARLPPAERAELSDYKTASDEFDRGHMSPSGDMPDKKSQRESFSLANMVPQNACNNEEIWEGIESAVRQLAQEEEEVFVITGPIYPANIDDARRIGEDDVFVPTELFKAIYVPTRDQGAAYVVVNEDTKEGRSLTLDGLQQLIGVDVFPNLTKKAKTTAMMLPPPHPPKFKCRLH